MIQNIPYPENFTPHTEQEWTEMILGPIQAKVFYPECSRMTLKADFDPRAQMCGVCINEAMAEASELFARGGFVASAEEHEAND